MRGSGHKVKHRKFWPYRRKKKCSITRRIELWFRLPRKVLESRWTRWKPDVVAVWDLQKSFPTSTVP